MNTCVSVWLHTAAMLHSQLLRSGQAFCTRQLPVAFWYSTVKLARQVELAHHQGWHFAARRQAIELLGELESLQASLAEVSTQLSERLAPHTIASQADLYRDLAALDAEFPGLKCDLESHTISVTTEPIVLEGILLGRFQIRLDVRQLPAASPYTVVALDPNPASSDSNVTHPHVNGESLCAGDGLRAIRSALSTGRLYDFFSIVHQTLQTYAQGRAYVELENWYGVACLDCGGTVDEDERCSCDRCEETLCSDCASSCCDCGNTCCTHCSDSCPRCDRIVCQGCLQPCRQCGTDVCRECLTQNLCSECQNHEPEPDEICPNQQPPIPSAPAAAV